MIAPVTSSQLSITDQIPMRERSLNAQRRWFAELMRVSLRQNETLVMFDGSVGKLVRFDWRGDDALPLLDS